MRAKRCNRQLKSLSNAASKQYASSLQLRTKSEVLVTRCPQKHAYSRASIRSSNSPSFDRHQRYTQKPGFTFAHTLRIAAARAGLPLATSQLRHPSLQRLGRYTTRWRGTTTQRGCLAARTKSCVNILLHVAKRDM